MCVVGLLTKPQAHPYLEVRLQKVRCASVIPHLEWFCC